MSNKWNIALVSRMSPQQPGGIRLKAAAAFAESGKTRDIATRIWQSPVGEWQELISKVFVLVFHLFQLHADVARKLTC